MGNRVKLSDATVYIEQSPSCLHVITAPFPYLAQLLPYMVINIHSHVRGVFLDLSQLYHMYQAVNVNVRRCRFMGSDIRILTTLISDVFLTFQHVHFL